MIDAVNKALELEYKSNEETMELTKSAFDIGIGSGALIGGMVGMKMGTAIEDNKKANEYKQMYANSVAKLLNEQNKKLVDMGSNYYSKIEDIEKDIKIMFTPLSVVFILRNTAIDTVNADTMNTQAREAWKRKDPEYFKNVIINKIYLDAQETEQVFIKRLMEQDKELRKALSKNSSEFAYVDGDEGVSEEAHLLEVLACADYFSKLFEKGESNESLNKYANSLISVACEWSERNIPVELGMAKFAGEDDFDLGMSKLAFLFFGKPNVMDMKELTPGFLKKHMTVVYLPDRILYITDNVVVSQLNVTKMEDEDYDNFSKKDDKYFTNRFFLEAKRLGKISAEEFDELEELNKESSFDTECPSEVLGGPLEDLLKAAGKITPSNYSTPLKMDLNEYIEKGASFREDFREGANGKIPALENAFKNPIAKKVAHMVATSHEYKTPNVKAALAFTKNYEWELSKERVSNLQGINKPVNDEKVDALANKINKSNLQPVVIVNQLNGVRPQTPGKKILMDGHHRIEACKKLGIMEVPVYKGKYTGGAEKSLEELTEKTAAVGDSNSFFKELFTRSGIHPKVYYLFLMKEFGNEWLEWDMTTILSSLKDIYGLSKISDIVENKIMCISLVLHGDASFTGYHTFEKVVRAFNDKSINFDLRESNLSLGEFVFAMRIMSDLISDVDDNLYDNFGEHTLSYLVEVLIDQNYRVCAHSTLSKNEQSFWDLVNLELLEYWVKILPTGLMGVSKDASKFEGKNIQNITKEVCKELAGDENWYNKISGRVDEMLTGTGLPTHPFSNIITNNVINSLSLTSFLEDKENQMNAQIKNYVS